MRTRFVISGVKSRGRLTGAGEDLQREPDGGHSLREPDGGHSLREPDGGHSLREPDGGHSLREPDGGHSLLAPVAGTRNSGPSLDPGTAVPSDRSARLIALSLGLLFIWG